MFSPFYGNNIKVIEQHSLKIKPGNLNILQMSLRQVTSDGTLSKLKISNNNIRIFGGKTGSATMQGEKYLTHGWNCIFFGFKGRDLVLLTFVYNGVGSKQAKNYSEKILNSLY